MAASKVTADDIKTWSVSEVDKKGKKKKGVLGIGNGSVFFASESDKVRCAALTLVISIDILFFFEPSDSGPEVEDE